MKTGGLTANVVVWLISLKLKFLLPLHWYLASKAEEIRSRRDHNAWLSRLATGLDSIQDPLSLLGGCLEGCRRLEKETDNRPQQLSPGGIVASAMARLPGESGYDRRLKNMFRHFYSYLESCVFNCFSSPAGPPFSPVVFALLVLTTPSLPPQFGFLFFRLYVFSHGWPVASPSLSFYLLPACLL